jgi:hypothetical protein
MAEAVSQTTVEEATSNALDAFWASVAPSFPSVVSGDVEPSVVMRLDRAAREAIALWVKANVPQSEAK